jgi:lipopolysaccharide biosynthesis glycosyltransferase
LPRLLPDIGRALCLDADTLVVGTLLELWNTRLDGCSIGAVANVVEPARRAYVTSLGVQDWTAYLNSGVLLVDVDAVRRDGSFDEALKLLARPGREFEWPDQDALNVVFRERWLRLHPRWNAMNSLWTWPQWAVEVFGDAVVREATLDPAILHFEGPAFRKPWHYLSDHPWRDAYRNVLARTPWADTPLEDRTLATRVLGRLPPGPRGNAYWRLVRFRERIARRREES